MARKKKERVGNYSQGYISVPVEYRMVEYNICVHHSDGKLHLRFH